MNVERSNFRKPAQSRSRTRAKPGRRGSDLLRRLLQLCTTTTALVALTAPALAYDPGKIPPSYTIGNNGPLTSPPKAVWFRKKNPSGFYVNRATGNDLYDCESATVTGSHGPCKTIPVGASAALLTDAAGHYLILNVAAGTYPEPVILGGSVSGSGTRPIPLENSSTAGGPLYIFGAGPSSTLIDIRAASAVTCALGAHGIQASNHFNLVIRNLEISTDCPGGSGLFVQNLATVGIGTNVKFGAATVAKLHIEAGGFVEGTTGFDTAGGGGSVIDVSDGGIYEGDPASIINCTGAAPTFTGGFLTAQSGGKIGFGTTSNFTNCGGIIGPQYAIQSNALITNQGSAAANHVPGSINGTRQTGGRYIPLTFNTPSVTAGGGCGNSPTILGNDYAGSITIGTGTTTSCKLTYAYPTSNGKVCTLSWDQATGAVAAAPPRFSSQATDNFVFNNNTTAMDGAVVRYLCQDL